MFGIIKKWFGSKEIRIERVEPAVRFNVEEIFATLKHKEREGSPISSRQKEEIEYGGVVVQRIHDRYPNLNRQKKEWVNGLMKEPVWYDTVIYDDDEISIKITQIKSQEYIRYFHDVWVKSDERPTLVASDNLKHPSGKRFRELKKEAILNILDDENDWSAVTRSNGEIVIETLSINLEEDNEFKPVLWFKSVDEKVNIAKKNLERLTQ